MVRDAKIYIFVYASRVSRSQVQVPSAACKQTLATGVRVRLRALKLFGCVVVLLCQGDSDSKDLAALAAATVLGMGCEVKIQKCLRGVDS